MLFFLLINIKMPTVVGILTFMSRKNFMLTSVEHENFITSGPVFEVSWKMASFHRTMTAASDKRHCNWVTTFYDIKTGLRRSEI